jgi:hypothetical protein
MTTPETTAISPEVAAHVLWCYDTYGGYRPDKFVESLIGLIGAADPVTRRKLALGFPQYVAACTEIETPGGGVETLQALAAKLTEVSDGGS